MSKKNTTPFDLKKFEQQVNRITEAHGAEFDKLRQEFNILSDKNDQMSQVLSRPWSSGVDDREVEEELNRLMAEVRLEQKEKELNKGVGKVPTTVEDSIPTVPTMEELLGGAELKRDPSQDKRLSAEGFSFNDNKDYAVVHLDAQAIIAKSSSELSTSPEEKEKLNEVVDKLEMISRVVKNTEVSKEDQPRMFEIIAKGLEKVYDGIKKLGGKFVESIKSIFKESPEKQLEKKRETVKSLYENFVELKGITGKVKEEFLKKHFNEIDKLTTPQEFLKETAKVTKAIQKAGQDKLLDIKNKHIENQKALHEKKPDRQNHHGFSPSPTPLINKGSSHGRI